MEMARSPFAHPGHAKVIELCQEALGHRPEIELLAYYDRGFHVFTLTRLPEEERRRQERAFRQLVTESIRFGDPLRELGTGELTRTFVQTEDGAVHCGHVFEEDYLVGSTRDAGAVEEMDHAVGRLITRIRREIYLQPDLMPGGRRGPRKGDPLPPATVRTECAEGLDAELATALTRLGERVVDVNDLHYLALHHQWRFAFAADVCDADALAPWFGGALGAEGARKRYMDLAVRMRSDLPALAYALRLYSERPLVRLVLDVVSGAIFVYPLLRQQGFVMGVTVFQPEVFAAEQRLRPAVPEIAGVLTG
ncbi:hypothetical protein Sme01_56910 [Sphaerisporangium melleum]|uniref:Uncharacterized protein n=1 Tax=Sphaerisporangium melleum TaxID=321316 RepID=A0A917R7F8_9ACTN|nr:hypothetical protein [Sphaerisporangium melleum]GGK94190.1 hypothetical protein GCM10007964_40790 [Sphaerisporangium melleum]GII73215.1 hypothetical protein Sme01_56910 [Sphaerisporangium melleum]